METYEYKTLDQRRRQMCEAEMEKEQGGVQSPQYLSHHEGCI